MLAPTVAGRHFRFESDRPRRPAVDAGAAARPVGRALGAPSHRWNTCVRESAGLATADGPVALNFLVHGSRAARLLYILMSSSLRLSLEFWMHLVVLVTIYTLGILGTFLSINLFYMRARRPTTILLVLMVLIMHVLMLAPLLHAPLLHALLLALLPLLALL